MALLRFIRQREVLGGVAHQTSLLEEGWKLGGYKYYSAILGHYGCVNAITLSKHDGGSLLASGSDDRRVLIHQTNRHPETAPKCVIEFKGEHLSNIFGVQFDNAGDHVLSCGNDGLIVRYDLRHSSPGTRQRFIDHNEGVQAVSFRCDSDHVFVSASDDGTFRVWDVRARGCQFSTVSEGGYTSLQCHPTDPHLLVTGNTEEGAKLWDLRLLTGTSRTTMPLLEYDLSGVPPVNHRMWPRHRWPEVNRAVSGISLNTSGTQAVLSIRNCFPCVVPVDQLSYTPTAIFTATGYRNYATLKSCTFAGPGDAFVVSGSDDYSIYTWKVPQSPGRQRGGWSAEQDRSKDESSRRPGRKRPRDQCQDRGEGAAAEPPCPRYNPPKTRRGSPRHEGAPVTVHGAFQVASRGLFPEPWSQLPPPLRFPARLLPS